jgi:hypothetical protein
MRWLLGLLLVGCGTASFTDDAMPDGNADATVACAAPYVSTPTGCYRFVPTGVFWLTAEQDCEDDAPDGHLVVIDSVDEHFTIHGLTDTAVDIWLAYTDRVIEGQMVWLAPGGIDPFPNPCFFGAATNAATTDCVTQDGTTQCGDWFYRDCNTLHAYVCERDGSPADRTRY